MENKYMCKLIRTCMCLLRLDCTRGLALLLAAPCRFHGVHIPNSYTCVIGMSCLVWPVIPPQLSKKCQENTPRWSAKSIKVSLCNFSLTYEGFHKGTQGT